MFFELFPTVDYINVGQTTSKTVTNIMRRVGVRQAIKENLQDHRMRSQEIPETIFSKVTELRQQYSSVRN